MNAGDCQTAKQSFTRVLKANRKHLDAYYNRGVCEMNTKDYEAAVSDFSRVVSAPSADLQAAMNARYNRGVCLMNLSRSMEAIADFNAIVQDDRASKALKAKAYLNRGKLRALLNDRAGAQEDFDAAHRLQP